MEKKKKVVKKKVVKKVTTQNVVKEVEIPTVELQDVEIQDVEGCGLCTWRTWECTCNDSDCTCSDLLQHDSDVFYWEIPATELITIIDEVENKSSKRIAKPDIKVEWQTQETISKEELIKDMRAYVDVQAFKRALSPIGVINKLSELLNKYL